MATSSIFDDFPIYDKEKAEAFVEALERSANRPVARKLVTKTASHFGNQYKI